MAGRFPRVEERLGRVDFQPAAGAGAVFQFHPTLVIGLGGSGVRTVRRLKRLQRARYGDVGMLQYLGVDTDQSGFAPERDLAPLGEDECAGLFVVNATLIHDEIRDGLRPELAEWLPSYAQVNVLENAEGTGGLRPAGRFAVFAEFDTFYTQKLESACARALRLEEEAGAILEGQGRGIAPQAGTPQVFIINSICGGNGSSQFIDTAILARRIFANNNSACDITGVFYLPSVFRYENIEQAHFNNMNANAYAALKEIEYLCDPDIAQRPYTVTYPAIGQVSTAQPVFDECYLVEISNAGGRQLTRADDVFEMTARSLAVNIGTPLGAAARAARVNYDPILLTEPCRETDKPRLMNSLATSSMRVPIEEMGLHCCLSGAHSVIRDHLIGSAGGEELAETVRGLLQRLDLEERRNQDRLLERLLRSSDGEPFPTSPRRTKPELEEEANALGHRGVVAQARFIAQWLERQLGVLQTEVLAEARRVVRSSQPAVRETALAGIRAEVERLTRSRGLLAAAELLSELVEALTEIDQELSREREDVAPYVRGLADEVREKAAALNEYGGLWDLLFHREDDDRAAEDGLGRLQDLWLNSVLQVARGAALELLSGPVGGEPGLLPVLRGWLAEMQRALAALDSAVKAVRRAQTGLPVEQARSGAHALDQLVVSPEAYPEWYGRLRLNTAQVASEVLAELGGPGQGDALKAAARLAALTGEPDAVVDLVAGHCVGPAMAVLNDEADFLSVQASQHGDANGTDSLVQRLASFVLGNCQPFWTTQTPKGRDRYLQHVAVTVPCSPGDPDYHKVETALRKWLEDLGVPRVSLVANANPFALEVAVQAYGARAYYLRSTEQMRQQYQQKARGGERFLELIHLDRRLVGELPDLYPDKAAVFLSLWAWGLAYGYIARRANFYYLGIAEGTDGDGQRIYSPKYETDWQAAITDRLEDDWRKRPQQRHEPTDRLGQGRDESFRAFVANEKAVEALTQARETYMVRSGESRLRADVQAYIQKVHDYLDHRQAADPAPYLQEIEALQAWLDSLG